VKQVIQDFKTGKLSIEEIPTPALRSEGVLVRTYFSLLSAGTERQTSEFAKKSLLGKAMARPDLVKKVLEKVKTEGPISTFKKSMQRLDTSFGMGYSSSGEVIAVGDKVSDLQVGDRVACGGAGYASHSEYAYVPRNLVVALSDNVSLEDAAYTTVGAVALEGVRNADLRIGESILVIGLGLVGLMALQLLKSNGCHVIAVDTDPRRVELAKKLGADTAVVRNLSGIEETILSDTGGNGVDAVLITAATSSNDPIEFAAEVARDRATISIIGKVGLNLPYKSFYEKALRIVFSRSYGPGRYDRNYEENGVDYPISYVRWTENRNMSEFARLLSTGTVDVSSLTTHIFDIEKGVEAYDLLQGKAEEPYIGILLVYRFSKILSVI